MRKKREKKTWQRWTVKPKKGCFPQVIRQELEEAKRGEGELISMKYLRERIFRGGII